MGNKVGFTTLTYKKGNSLKTGPTILLDKFRGQGIGCQFRVFIDSFLQIDFKRFVMLFEFKLLTVISVLRVLIVFFRDLRCNLCSFSCLLSFLMPVDALLLNRS